MDISTGMIGSIHQNTALTAEQGWCKMKPNFWSFRVPMTTVERKPTVDELYIHVLQLKLDMYKLAENSSNSYSIIYEYGEQLNDAIAYYKRLVKKVER